ncbi:DUF1642 domain-containing protein [Tetragenococcus halophilus]|uniref:DUF1642 domain-containing protein n=1 Tax=Tetragenococcus halophilus TaxID=51669 RepID=UPI0030C8E9DF
MNKQELENVVLNPGFYEKITVNGKNYTREDKVLSLIDQLDEPEITTEQAWEKIAEEYKLPVETVQQIAGTTISSAVKKEDIAIRDGCIILNPNLTEPENPEIPAELAKRIENFKGKVTDDYDDYIIYSIFLDDEYDNLKKDTHQWIKDNPGKLSRAVVNGYTIEKEPVWVVRINGKLYFCSFTDKYFEKNSDAPTYIESGNPSLIKKFTNKDKAEAVATLVDGTVKEWSE